VKNFLLFLLVVWGLHFAFTRNAGGGGVAFPRYVQDPTAVRSVPVGQRTREFLFTGTTWCGACQQLESSVISGEAWRQFSEQEILFLKYDIPADQGSAPASALSALRQYGVRAFPTMVPVDGNGNKVSEFVGSGPPTENFKGWIRDNG
jgi:thioredoxin-related protein